MSLERTSSPDIPGRFDIFDYGRQGVVLLLCAIFLSSCGPVISYLDRDNAPPEVVPDSVTHIAQGADSPTTTITLPPMISPPKPGQSGTAYTPNGLPALQPRGVNVDDLFAERIKDEDKRFNRLENAVLDMRREFEAVKPSIIRLVAVEQDMQDLVAQLETLLRNEPPSPAIVQAEIQPVTLHSKGANAPPATKKAVLIPAAQPPPSETSMSQEAAANDKTMVVLKENAGIRPSVSVSAPAPVSAQAPAPTPVSTSGVQVKDLRIGEHSDKTRLVFDVTGPVSYRYDIDNEEKIMIIELPGTGWAGPAQWKSGKAPLLASYTVSPSDGGGSRVIVQLKKAVSVVYETKITGKAGEAFRIVIDLRSASVK